MHALRAAEASLVALGATGGAASGGAVGGGASVGGDNGGTGGGIGGGGSPSGTCSQPMAVLNLCVVEMYRPCI